MAKMVQEALIKKYIHTTLAALFLIISSAQQCSQQCHELKIKSLHFVLYEQNIVNKTVYLIVKGVAGPAFSPTTSPFGSLFAFSDPITMSPELSSRVVGTAEGSSMTSSFDGFRNTNVVKFTIEWEGHVGSISTVGVSHNTEPADAPVVGGTGGFMFVQGFVRTSAVEGFPLAFKLEFHLYWPPYAHQITSLEVEDLSD